jgi:uncharacterized protein (TIGR00297 family)
VIARVLGGAAAASLIAFTARAARSLSPSGAIAAALLGTSSVAAGWSWGLLLIVFFLSSTLLSRYRRAAKEARTNAIVEKGDERDAMQVLANGGVFALAAVGSLVVASPFWHVVGAGSLAAATADTWATEIGTLARRAPRSIVSGAVVAPGTSGGVSLPGTLAALSGATLIALVVGALGWSTSAAMAVFAGGVAGALADSLMGATVQERRYCDACNVPTERLVHTCGTPTRVVGGIPRLRNDAVNAVCAVVGAIVAAFIVR